VRLIIITHSNSLSEDGVHHVSLPTPFTYGWIFGQTISSSPVCQTEMP